MKSASAGLRTALETSNAVSARYRVIAEFNHNRYSTPTIAGDDWNPEYFPLSSVVEPYRRDTGVLYTRLTTHPNSTAQFGRERTNTRVDRWSNINPLPEARFYYPSESSKYKYWSSSIEAITDGNFVEPQAVTVTYPEIKTNKIVVGLEISQAVPNSYSLEARVNGVWETVTNSVFPDTSGRIVVYYNGTSWTTTPDYLSYQIITGVRFTVFSMTDRSFLNLIEISPRLEVDVTDYVDNDPSSDASMSRDSFISPIGEVSSNTGRINLINHDGAFTLPGGLFEGLVKKNAKITQQVGIFNGTAFEYLTIGTLFVEEWERGEHTLSATLKDGSVFLQNIECPKMLMEKSTAGACVWRLMDAIGFGDYRYVVSQDDASNIIDYFWTDPEQSVWDNIRRLCAGTQTAVYFDDYGVLQIVDGKKALTADVPAWHFSSDAIDTKLSDIVSFSYGPGLDTNTIKVNHYPTSLTPDVLGVPQQEILWQGEDPLVVRASTLVRDITAVSDSFVIDVNDAKLWPFEGKVNIEGEIIKYSGKKYLVYRSPTTYTFHTVRSVEQQQALDDGGFEAFRYRNHYTGELMIESRGEWNTNERNHLTGSRSNYVARFINVNTAGAGTARGNRFDLRRNEGVLYMNTSTAADAAELTYVRSVTGGIAPATTGVRFGTRLRFKKQYSGLNMAGIALQGTGANGLYVGVTTTETAENSRVANVFLWEKNGSSYGGLKQLGKQVIVTNQWVDIDVEWKPTANSVGIFINGIFIKQQPFTWTGASEGNMAPWVRGKTEVDFEYMYGVPYREDDAMLFSQENIDGSFGSTAWASYTKPRILSIRGKTWGIELPSEVMAEFAPVVHEVREFDVQFEAAPVVSASLFLSDQSQVDQVYFVPSPYGAKFAIVNTTRRDAIIQGNDEVTIPGETIDQTTFIYGKPVKVGPSEESVVKDDAGVREAGVIETSFDTEFVQTKTAADALTRWVSEAIKLDNRELSLTVFGNPVVEIGDTVLVSYPEKGLTADTFIVLGRGHSWSFGLSTQLTLRKAME